MRYLIVAVLLLSGCSWSQKDKALAGSLIALTAIDIAQTNSSVKTGDFEEGNSALGSSPGGNNVIIGASVVNALIIIIADTFPEYRTMILSFAVGVEGHTIYRNNKTIKGE